MERVVHLVPNGEKSDGISNGLSSSERTDGVRQKVLFADVSIRELSWKAVAARNDET